MKNFRSLFPNFRLYVKVNVFYSLRLVNKTNQSIFEFNPIFSRSILKLFHGTDRLYYHWIQSQLEYSLLHLEDNKTELISLLEIDYKKQFQKSIPKGDYKILIFENDRNIKTIGWNHGA
ncbi:MAG: hypothetical protein AB8E15_14130 [Bdellovibrionales bacterium]